MASKHLVLFLCFSVLFLVTSTNARTIPSVSMALSANYTKVCDKARFSSLGMDMSSIAFCDSSLPYEVRVKDLIDRMTLAEKVKQLGNTASGVERIGLPTYEWWSEALHGVSDTGPGTYFDDVVPGATSFPIVTLTTASFNQPLWKKIGQTVSNEARAMHNLGRAGLTFWSPTINLVRDPRWGRTMESPGEDPFVIGTYAATYVRGLQDVEGTLEAADLNSRPLKVAACCKHYTAYDLESWFGYDRWHFNSNVTEQDMIESFNRPFEMCVRDGDASSAMCSFNNVNGIPTCADARLLRDTIRGDWNLHGYIVSDCDSIEVIVDKQKWLSDTAEEAVGHVMKAGLDLDCGDYYPKYGEGAVKQGLIKEEDIDQALKYTYQVLMRLGFFDGSSFSSLGKDDLCTEENMELAAEAARQGIVLLKNNNTLPLKPAKYLKLAIVGPHANATEVMIGNYAGVPCRYVSPIEAFSLYGKVDYQLGCDTKCHNDSLIWPAVRASKKADATIIFAGLEKALETEGTDRIDLKLPGYQEILIKQIASVSKGPVILVIMSGGGVDISFAKNNHKVGAILWAGYPGQEGGRAIADVIYGKHNPSGRLPLTWYPADYAEKLPMTSMKMRPVESLGYPGRTYKFYNGSTVFPFGYGLSYTNFSYTVPTFTNRSLPIMLNRFTHCRDALYESDAYKPLCPAVSTNDLECAATRFDLEVVVENVGERDGSDVVMVYSKPPLGLIDGPIKQLIGFERVFVKAGQSEKVKFEFDGCKALGIVDYKGSNILPAGHHTIVLRDDSYSIPFHVSFHNYK